MDRAAEATDHPTRNATFFEATTAIALADFAARGVDIAVAEVGLGGRLDSTNVVQPAVSGVTRIARDHMKYLGDTLEAIAREKAGIAKPGVPFVIGETDPALVAVLRAAARATVKAQGGSGPMSGCCPPTTAGTGRSGSRGPHQRRNAAVAHGILMALPERYRPDRGRRSRRDSRRRGSRGGSTGGEGGCSMWPTIPTAWRRWVTRHPRLPTCRGPSMPWSRSWATRSGPKCWSGSTRWSTAGVLTDRAVGGRSALGHDLAPALAQVDPDRPPARAEWSLVPEFGRALRGGAGGSGDGPGDGLVPHRRRRDGRRWGWSLGGLRTES